MGDMKAYEEDKKWFNERYGPGKKPAGAAGAALAPKPKPETMDEMNKRQNDEIMQAEPKDRPAILKRHEQESKDWAAKQGGK